MCKRCAGLIDLLDERNEEIRQLRDELGRKYDREKPQYGLQPTEWRVFRALLDRFNLEQSNRLLPSGLHKERLIYLLDRPAEEYADASKHLAVVITKIRKKILHLGMEIQPVWGQGYVLVDRNKEAA